MFTESDQPVSRDEAIAGAAEALAAVYAGLDKATAPAEARAV